MKINNNSPSWSRMSSLSPSSKCSSGNPEDGFSICSSSANTPKLEEDHHSDLLNSSSSASLIEPMVSSAASGHQPNTLPSINQNYYTNHQKILSHYCDSFIQTNPHNYRTTSDTDMHVSYSLYPATSPVLSTTFSVSSNRPDPYFLSNSYHSQDTSSSLYPSLSFHPSSTHSNYGSSEPHYYHSQQTRYPKAHDSSSNFVRYDTNGSFQKPNKTLTRSPSLEDKDGSHPKYSCTVDNCNKIFSRPYNLKSHMRTHNHERPYECKYAPCGWKFARPHDLKRHELQHTGQKPHHCRFCSKKFARSDALKRHWKVDTSCANALKEETRLNGGIEVQYARRKRSKNTTTKKQNSI